MAKKRRSRRKKYYRRPRRMKTYRRKRRRSNPNPNPPRRRRRKSYRSYGRKRRRSYRNPPRAMVLGTELMWAGVGFLGTKMTGNFITPMLPVDPTTQPLMRIGIKAGTAYLAAWAGEMLMGRAVFMPMFLGGAMSAVEDVIKTFIVPTFPMLADDLDIYPPLVGRYPALPGGEEGELVGDNEMDMVEAESDEY